MEEIESNVNVLELPTEEQTKWAYEQNALGRTQKELAELLNIDVSTLRRRIKKYKENHELMNTEKNTNVQITGETKTNRPKITQKNSNVLPLSEDEINVIKEIIEERKSDLKLFHEFRVYKELSKVPTNEETVRSAFNMSKTTTERLKKYANERRLPLQDLAELAIINLLDQYDKKN